jgi:hypothetical protein
VHAGFESDDHPNSNSHTYSNTDAQSDADADALPHTYAYTKRTGDSSGSDTVRRGLAAAQQRLR